MARPLLNYLHNIFSREKAQALEDVLLIFGIALALFFAFLSGFRDGGNLIAANVLSKSLPPRKALYVACAGEFLGPFVLGSAVAVTLGREVFDMASLDGPVALLCLFTGLASATVWSLLTWWAGSPAGATHSLLGGLLGGFVAASGMSGVHWSGGLQKVLLVLFAVPIAGFALSASITGFSRMGIARSGNKESQGQWLTLFVMSAGHGTNNANKATALIAMMLMASGYLGSFEVPFWSLPCAAVALTFGFYIGAWRMVKVFGRKPFRISPAQSLISQVSAAAVVLAATFLGCPVSTNQIVKSSLVVASPVERQKEPAKIVIKDILIAWSVNFPAAAVMAAVLYWIVAGALGHGMGSFEGIMELMGQ